MSKNRRIGWLSLSLLAALFFLSAILSLPGLVLANPSGAADPLQSGQKIGAALKEAIQFAGPDEEVHYIIYVDPSSSLDLDTLPQEELSRRSLIVSTLRESAGSSQAALLNQLETLTKGGQVSSYTSLWIINAIAVSGMPSSVIQLAGHPDVQRIEHDQAHQYFDPPQDNNQLIIAGAKPGSNNMRAWGVQRIQADKVWRELDTRGQGTTVAVVDTGVDLFHPDLIDNYRGNLGDGNFTHKKNWFHTIMTTSTVPFDFHGHGTHVTGSAVGSNGIGVAPGAKWIAVAIADESGLIYDSSVHSAFQWLLAPGGDPSAAPDIINNSWGGAGGRTEFQPDVQILHAAGIITVFAAGNAGPAQGTVLSPASFPGTIAVGASDDLNQPAWFSGRGPSPLTSDIKPLLLAPGTQIISAKPGGSYSRQSGTSMSAPHVAGTIALMLSADPSMRREDVINTLIETATPLSEFHPNKDSGWGLLDAFSAVLSRGNHGTFNGTVTDGQQALEKVLVTISDGQGLELTKLSGPNGQFSFLLPPGFYKLNAQTFGFEELNVAGIQVQAGSQIDQEINLQKQAGGQVRGTVSDNEGPLPEAKIIVSKTPIVLTTDAGGGFQTFLPQGEYTMIIEAKGHRLKKEILQIKDNQEYLLNVNLDIGPSILIVDSGQWQYESAAPYYRNALQTIGYSSDIWVISDPNNALPSLDDLLPYDIVIWSSPNDSPGRLAVDDVLIHYLNQGGKLLISGQNLASLDGRAGFEESWFRSQLEGEFVGELKLSGSEPRILGAHDTPFFGLNLTLNGQNSAGNQASPDLVKPRQNSFSEPIFFNKEGTAMGLQSGFCEPYRIVYLGFGLEGVNHDYARHALLKASLDSLQAPRNSSGVGWIAERERELVIPGQQLLLDIELQNLGELITDTFDITLNSNGWQGQLVTPTLTLEPCQIGRTSLVVEVPETSALDLVHNLELTAVSQSNSQTRARVTLELKTPGQILLVDDDRFFDGAPAYTSALEKLDLNFDFWDTEGRDLKPNIPPEELLNIYEYIIWFTGYDWHAPVTQRENAALTQYLRQGGRLFLSSQDYLFYNQYTSLTRELGIVDYQETVTPTVVYAEPSLALSDDLAGPLPLSFDPYQNFSDGLIPSAEGIPIFWHDQGMAAGVGRSQGIAGRSIFWGFPFETLPVDQQVIAMNAVLGWLTDFGDSSFETDRQRGPLNETRSFTLTLRNTGRAESQPVAVTNSLPNGLQLMVDTLKGDAIYDEGRHQIIWQGSLKPGRQHQISYQASFDQSIASGSKLVNEVLISDPQQGFSFVKSLPMWFNVPDLSQSKINFDASSGPLSSIITYSLSLNNNSLNDSNQVTATLRFPDSLNAMTDTLTTNLGNIQIDNHQIIWHGTLPSDQIVTASLVLTRSTYLDFWLPSTAIIEDGQTDPLILHDLQYLPPYQSFFPVFR